MTDAAAILTKTNRRQATALKELYHWTQTLKGFADPNVQRVAGSMERIIEEAL